jgi:hypothetical protein
VPLLVIRSSCSPFLLFLLQIIWENWVKNDWGNDCLTTVDGTYFRIAEHRKPFYSHKFKKSGLRYVVGLSIGTGDIVWLNGPYEYGQWPDISIFRDSLLSHLSLLKELKQMMATLVNILSISSVQQALQNPNQLFSCSREPETDRKQSTKDSRIGDCSSKCTGMKFQAMVLPLELLSCDHAASNQWGGGAI